MHGDPRLELLRQPDRADAIALRQRRRRQRAIVIQPAMEHRVFGLDVGCEARGREVPLEGVIRVQCPGQDPRDGCLGRIGGGDRPPPDALHEPVADRGDEPPTIDRGQVGAEEQVRGVRGHEPRPCDHLAVALPKADPLAPVGVERRAREPP